MTAQKKFFEGKQFKTEGDLNTEQESKWHFREAIRVLINIHMQSNPSFVNFLGERRVTDGQERFDCI